MHMQFLDETTSQSTCVQAMLQHVTKERHVTKTEQIRLGGGQTLLVFK